MKVVVNSLIIAIISKGIVYSLKNISNPQTGSALLLLVRVAKRTRKFRFPLVWMLYSI